MTEALYTVVRSSYPGGRVGKPVYGIIADAVGVEYVALHPIAGINDARIERLLARRQNQRPTAPLDWLKLAAQNLGYARLDPPIAAPTFDAARERVQAELR